MTPKASANGDRTIVIDRRFRGPPESGNGGYCGGVFAESFDGPVEVTFRRPIPLDAELTFTRKGDGAVVTHGSTLIAEVELAVVDLVVPAPPSAAEASAANGKYLGRRSESFFAGCFGCGLARAEGDGLRVFPGPCGANRVATPWVPHAAHAAADGTMPLPVLWAALDCPGGFVIMEHVTPGRLTVTGKLAVRVDLPMYAGRDYIIESWLIERGARKHSTGAAISDAAGTVCAVARAVWLEPKSA